LINTIIFLVFDKKTIKFAQLYLPILVENAVAAQPNDPRLGSREIVQELALCLMTKTLDFGL